MDPETKRKLYGTIETALRGLEYDVTKRNSYMNERYNAVYGDGLYSDLDIPQNEWFAQYNLVGRVVDIYTAQLFGRGFTVVSDYSKEDLSAVEGNPEETTAMQMKNKRLKADAESRMKLAQSFIDDNGGMSQFEDGGQLGSVVGETIFKMWPDMKKKKVNLSLIESPQNYRAGWSSDNFRERDFDSYTYQMSPDAAMREYGKHVPDGEVFHLSKMGSPLQAFDSGNTADPLSQSSGITHDKGSESERPAVTVVDVTGFIPGWGVKGGKLVEVERGEETRISVLCVGGWPCQIITKEKYLPKYYRIPNRKVPRQAWGASDISDSLIDINKEIVRLERDMGVWADKNLWKILMAKGMDEPAAARLRGKKRTTKVITMEPEQDIVEVQTSSQPMSEFSKLIDQKLDLFTRIAGVGRVLFDDPTVNANSNQALMTTLKGVIDIIESKQKRWEIVLVEMFTDALYMSAELVPEVKAILDDDPSWKVKIEWPSVLRREDQTYQTMWLNMFNAKAISMDTYLQKTMGENAAEEMDRLRDNFKDPVMAAILGGVTNLLATNLITPAPTEPPPPDIKYAVNIKADASLDPVANADLIRVVDPQLPDMGVGSAAEAGAMPTPDQAANPTLSAGENTGQSTSQPGSGAPAVSPAGAVAQSAQNRGA